MFVVHSNCSVLEHRALLLYSVQQGLNYYLSGLNFMEDLYWRLVRYWAFLLGSWYKYKSHLLKPIMYSHRCRLLGDILSTLHLH